MSTPLKVLLIIFACLVLLSIAVAGVGIYFWRQHGAGLIESGKQIYGEGNEYGRETDEAGCFSEALARHKKAEGFGELIKINLFFRSCLETSRQTQGFCEGVPTQDEFIKSVQWQMEQCTKHGLTQEKQCGQLFAQLQQHCASRQPEQQQQP